jgi:hypothetical protein
MTKRQLTIRTLVVLVLAVGVWVLSLRHNALSTSGKSNATRGVPETRPATPPMPTPAKSIAVSVLWARPAAKAAARNSRRVRFAVLKPFGATDQIINRLTDGDMSVIQELKQQALGGDAAAGNVLYFMARFNCAFARIDLERADLRAQASLDGQALPPADAEWLRTASFERATANQQPAQACNGIDRSEAEGWMNKAADEGNPASLFEISIQGQSKHKRKPTAAAGESDGSQ